MADQFRIEAPGLDRLETALLLFPAKVQQEATAVTWQATQQLEAQVKPLTPADLGALKNSYGSEVKAIAGGVQGIMGSNSNYGAFVEYGTKPHWPPISAIEPWAQRHNIPAFLVARAIAKRGTKAVKMMEKTYKAQYNNIVNLYERMIARVVGGFGL